MSKTQTTVADTNDSTDNATDMSLPAASEETTSTGDDTNSELPANTAIQGNNTASTPPTDTSIQNESEASDASANTALQEGGANSIARLPGVSSEMAQDLQQGTDDINLDIARMAVKAGAVQNVQETEPEGAGSFDTLPVIWKEEQDGGEKPKEFPEDLWALKQQIGKLREGELYQAVLVARELKSGRTNPMATGRARRYFNKASGITSSALDIAADANKVFASTVGIASTIDRKGKYKPVLQGAALVSNFISIMTTSRDIYHKAKDFFKTFKTTSITDKLFQGIALCGDLSTWLSKACSIAKTIVNYFGGVNKPMLKEITKWLTLALNMGTQIAGIANASRGIHKQRKMYKQLSDAEDKMWTNGIQPILNAHGVSTDTNEEPSDDKPVNGDSEKEDGNKEESVKEASEQEESKTAEDSSETSKEMSSYQRQKAVEQLLENSPNLSEKEENALLNFLSTTRKKDKIVHTIVATSSGIVASVTGLCSSLFTSAVYGMSYDKGIAKKLPGIGTAGIGVITNSVAIGSIGLKTYAKRQAGKGDSRSDLIGDRLWGRLAALGEEQYGLKGLEEELTNGPGSGKDMGEKKNWQIKSRGHINLPTHCSIL